MKKLKKISRQLTVKKIADDTTYKIASMKKDINSKQKYRLKQNKIAGGWGEKKDDIFNGGWGEKRGI